jgi:hypothetical protein
MIRPAPPLLETLDESLDLALSIAAPWMGLLWLTAIPLRLAQAHYVARLRELGAEAAQYGDQLTGLAFGVSAALVVSLLGRALFVRALTLRLSAVRVRGGAVLRLPAASLGCYLYLALLIEVVGYVTCLGGVGLPFATIAAALAAATAPLNQRPGLLRPLGILTSEAGAWRSLFAMLAVFVVAAMLAALNLFFVFRLGLWAATGVAGLELARWEGLLSFSNPRFVSLLLAGGWLVVEPFWLAAVTLHVQKTRAQTSGVDLRLWFERLRGESS